MKRILLLFSALMLSSITLWADRVEIDGIYYYINEGDKTAKVGQYHWSEPYSGSITIPDYIYYNSNNYSVTSIDNYAFYECNELTEITIGKNVTSIDSFAFVDCSALTKITIGKNVTSIDNSAFYSCSELTSIIWNAKEYASDSPFDDIRDQITTFTIGNEVEHIPAYLCSSMVNLTEITIPNSVTSIGDYAFNRCSGLTEIIIPNSVTSIGDEAFRDCSGIKEFIVSPNNQNYYSENGVLFNKDKTELIQCPATKLDTTYNIPNSVTSIGDRAFYECSGITEINIPNSVTSIGLYAFYGCSGLTEIIIPNSVTSIGEKAFRNCSGLTKITIGKNVTSIGENAFYGCHKLTKIIAYPTTVPTVDIAYSTFSNYNAYLYVPCEVYEKYDLDAEFGKFKYIKCIEDEIPSAVIENLAEANITIYNGLITVSDTSFSIYNLAGQNVTALNGFLQPGVYLVSVNDNIAKVMVK